jgi:raffinose/stachyose/melibiose transport system permease protein
VSVVIQPRPSRRTRPGAPRAATTWDRIQPVVALAVIAIVLGAPLWLVVVTAGKSQGEALDPTMSLPHHGWHFTQNFADALEQGRVLHAFLGSVAIVVPSVVLLLLFGSMASWVLARRSSRLLSLLYATAISGIVLPPAIITLVLLLRQLSLAGTLVGMVLVYAGIYMSTAIFFITGFIRTIPIELEEAARVDGAGPIRTFFFIVLPLLRPVLATATILICLYIWNDVFFAFFVIGGRMDTLPLNLFQVASAGLYQNNWNLIFAYVILMSLPLLVIFVVAQRKIVAGITGGAVK